MKIKDIKNLLLKIHYLSYILFLVLLVNIIQTPTFKIKKTEARLWLIDVKPFKWTERNSWYDIGSGSSRGTEFVGAVCPGSV